MTSIVPHVRLRGQVFQYERRVPQSVQNRTAAFAVHFKSRPLYRRSLRTKSRLQVYEAAAEAHREFERLVDLALGKPTQTPQPALVRKLTEADQQAIYDQYWEATVRPYERALLRADGVPSLGPVADALREDSAFTVEAYRQAHRQGVSGPMYWGERDGVRTGVVTQFAEAKGVIEEQGYDAPEGSAGYGAIVRAIRSAVEQGLQRILEIDAGKVMPRLPADKTQQVDDVALTLRAAVEAYLAHKKLPSKTESEVQLSLRQFEAVVGNKPLSDLQTGDFLSFARHLAAMTVGGKTIGSIKRHLSGDTLAKRVGFLRSAINHVINKGDYTGSNPAVSINTREIAVPRDVTSMPDKRRITVDEMNKVLRHPWYTGCKSPERSHEPGGHFLETEYWVMAVEAYTGCRVNELGGLRVAEVNIDGACPHFHIQSNEYRRTKGGYARRVPILDALLELGFDDYFEKVACSGADRLFPLWLPKGGKQALTGEGAWSDSPMIRAFNRTVVPSMLGDALVKGARQVVTFHSFRGAFKAMLGRPQHGVPPIYVKEVIGHSKDDLEERYDGEIPIEDTYEAVHRCRYSGLVFPSAPSLRGQRSVEPF